MALSYLSKLLNTYNSKWALRSSRQMLLVQLRLNHRGGWAFAVAAPRLWNNLPDDIRTSESFSLSNRVLKLTFLRWLLIQVHFEYHQTFFVTFVLFLCCTLSLPHLNYLYLFFYCFLMFLTNCEELWSMLLHLNVL